MPPRFNLFQDVVAIIERHKAASTFIKESAELIDRDTGEKREVDVVVTSVVDGAEVVMGIEAADRSRAADVPWVEQQIAKHCALGTDQLVLVAAAGFYGPALRKALAHGAVTIAPEDLDADHEFAVISKLAAPPATVEPTLTGAVLNLRIPKGTSIVGEPGSVSRDDGAAVDLHRIAYAIFDLHFEGFVAKAAEDLSQTVVRQLTVTVPPPEPLFAEARRDDTGAMVRVPVEGVQIDVSVDVQLHQEMNMVARLFDETATLYGETKLGNDQAIFVATDHAGMTRATLRTRESGHREPVDWRFDGAVDVTTPDV